MLRYLRGKETSKKPLRKKEVPRKQENFKKRGLRYIHSEERAEMKTKDEAGS